MITTLIEELPMITLFGVISGFLIYILALEQIDFEDLIKGFFPVLFSVFITCFFVSCGIGDVGTSRTEVSSNSATDNSTDNSLHGISQCTQGSTIVCTAAGPQNVATSQECINANGEPVVLSGPDIVSTAEAATICPTPEPVAATDTVPADSGAAVEPAPTISQF